MVCSVDGGDSVEFDSVIDDLIGRNLLLREGRELLSLALPLSEYSPNLRVLKRFQSIVESLGIQQDGAVTIDVASRNAETLA